MQNVIYAATGYGYCVQVIDGGEVVYEYSAGNHQQESQAFVDPVPRRPSGCPNSNAGPNRRRMKLPMSGGFQPTGSSTTPIWKPS